MDYFDILLAKKLKGGGGDVTVVPLSVSENGTYSEEGKAYSPVTVEVAPPEDSYQLKSITTPTSLATFEASEMPMPSLKVSVEAKQDLHGYDKPWVGGAGKNKLPMTVDGIKAENPNGTWNGNTFTHQYGVRFTIETDIDNNVTGVRINGTADGGNIIFYLCDYTYLNGTYTLTGCPTGGGESLARLDARSSEGVIGTDTGSGANFSANNIQVFAAIRIGIGITVSNFLFKPMIRLTSVSDPTFAPYSNICPISGWSEVNVSDVGKNKANPDTLEVGYYSTSGYINNGNFKTTAIIPVDEGKTYFGSIFNINDLTERYDVVYSTFSTDDTTHALRQVVGESITIQSGEKYIRVRNNSDQTPLILSMGFVYQLELGSTATTYEPYINQTTTISLPQTVYGGVVDVVNGGGKSSYAISTLNNMTDWGYNSDYGVFYFYAYSKKAGRVNLLSDRYKVVDLPYQNMSDGEISGSNGTGINIKDDRYNNINDFLTANGDSQLIYELATPTTLTTQPTPIKSLEGTNNLSVDCGEVIEGEYFKALGGA